MSVKLYPCEPLTPELIASYGTVLYLPYDKAKKLHARGKVKMMLNPHSVDQSTMKQSLYHAGTGKEYLCRSAFKNDGSTRVAWVQDYSKTGGAELSNITVVQAGEQCGFDIVGITPGNFHEQVLLTSDVIILNNIHEFNSEQMQSIFTALYEYRIKYVKYDHDYRDLSRGELAYKIFSCSALNVFISPAHMLRYTKKFGPDIVHQSVALPLAIDTDLFKIKLDSIREPHSVLVPTARKCMNSLPGFIKDHPEYSFTVVGGRLDLPGKVRFVGKQSPEGMVDLYNTHEMMYHCPDVACPGERLYFEALLCGCIPLVNDNVGHSSWRYETGLKSFLDAAPFEFWRHVDKAAQG